MTFKCTKCNMKFSTQYHLNLHVNKQTPCNIILKCSRCDQIFTRQITLDKHMARKNPCKSLEQKKSDKVANITTKKELKLLDLANKIELEKIKAENKQNNARIKKESKENEAQLEQAKKENDARIKKELKQLDIKAKVDIIAAKVAAKAAAKQQDLENKQKLKELDIEKVRLVEEARTARKMLTVKAINYKIDLEAHQLKNQQITKSQEIQARIINYGTKLIEPMDMIFSEFDLEKFYGKIYSSIDFKALFLEYDTLHDIIAHILKLLLNNDNYQNKRCLFYFTEDEQFYSTYFDINKMFIQTSFKDVYAGLYMRIDEICRTLVISGPAFFKFTNGENEIDITKKFERFSKEYNIFKRSKPHARLVITYFTTQRDILLETFMKSFENALSKIIMTNL